MYIYIYMYLFYQIGIQKVMTSCHMLQSQTCTYVKDFSGLNLTIII